MSPNNALDRPCSVARTIQVLGDRWTLLILREAFFGARRFDVFQSQLGIARNILTNRLKRLVENQILLRRPYQERPPRYEYVLSERGMDLYEVVLTLILWGDKWLAGEEGPPLELRHGRHRLRPVMVCEHCGEAVDPRDVSYRDGPGAR